MESIEYYLRRDLRSETAPTLVRVIDKVFVEVFFNGEWYPNQEWYISMFDDGDEDIEIEEISKEEAAREVEERKKLIR